MVQDEYLFYYYQYQKASDFDDYINCSDLIKEFEQLSIQYQQNKDDTLYPKFENNIKSFYKRGLPEWFRYLDMEIEKSEGKYLEYFEERKELSRIRRKFEQNNLDLVDYTDLLTQFEELDSKIGIKKSIERYQEKQNWHFLLISAAIGFVLGLISGYLIKIWLG